uniref:Uncharacterized protein n=1 Tax=Chenopodium quinoa TaxID=63459 RepID=A0A803KMF0_CHEQI
MSITRVSQFNKLAQSRNSQIHLKFSTISKGKTQSKSPNTQKPGHKKQALLKKDDHDSLFSEITEILGTGNLALSKIPSGVSVPVAMTLDFSGNGNCTQGVCENAQEKIEGESEEVFVSRDKAGNLTGIDDNRFVVQKITEIVRQADADGWMIRAVNLVPMSL